MRLLNFKATNLFSLGDVELDLTKRGLLLVNGYSMDEGGANGSGKSSLSNKGILWTLYGQTASGDKADAVINRFGNEDVTTVGSINVEALYGTQYCITRTRNPARLEIFDVTNAVDISCKNEKDTQELINKILGRSRDIFLQTDFFGQGKVASFLDLTPKAQIELLETILPFDRLNELHDKTKELLTKLSVIEASVNRKYNETNGKLLEAQRQERILSEKVDEWETNHVNELDKISKEIAQLEANDTITAQINAIGEEILTLPSKELTVRTLEQLASRHQTLTEVIKDMKELLFRYNVGIKELASLDAPTRDACKTCGQTIDVIIYDALKQDYDRKQLKLKHFIEDSKKDGAYLDNCQQELNEIESKTKECQRVLAKYGELDVKLAKLEVERSKNPLQFLREKLNRLNQEINPYVGLYNDNSSTIKSLLGSVTCHKSRLEEIATDKGALEFWQAAFNKELKNEFLSQVCPYLESRINTHLQGLDNGQIKVKVSTLKTLKNKEDRSEFTVSVSSTTGGGTYDALSGGEKQMTNFAVGLALSDLAESQVIGSSKFMVLDEPFTALDDRNSENLVNYLNSYLNNKKETILLVSNEETLKTLITNRIQVIKENGITRIEHG